MMLGVWSCNRCLAWGRLSREEGGVILDVWIISLLLVKIKFLPCPCYACCDSRYLYVAKRNAGNFHYFVVRLICTFILDHEKRKTSQLYTEMTLTSVNCVLAWWSWQRKIQMVQREVLRKTFDEKQHAGCEQSRILHEYGLRDMYSPHSFVTV